MIHSSTQDKDQTFGIDGNEICTMARVSRPRRAIGKKGLCRWGRKVHAIRCVVAGISSVVQFE